MLKLEAFCYQAWGQGPETKKSMTVNGINEETLKPKGQLFHTQL
jgi:hypothetical protein